MPVEFDKLSDEEKKEVLSKVLEDENLFSSLLEESKKTENQLFTQTALENIVKGRLTKKEKELLETKDKFDKVKGELETLKQGKTEQKTSDMAVLEAALEKTKTDLSEAHTKYVEERELRKKEYKSRYLTGTLLKAGANPKTLEEAVLVASHQLSSKLNVVEEADGWRVEAIDTNSGTNKAEEILGAWLDEKPHYKKGAASGAPVDDSRNKVKTQTQKQTSQPAGLSGARGMESALRGESKRFAHTPIAVDGEN